MAKWGLVAVPVVFAVGCPDRLGHPHQQRDPGADPRSVAEAIAWAKGQPVPRIFPRSVRTRAGEWVRGKQSVPVVPAPGTAEPAGRTGVCFSGGGVRSAAYNLGALQELQASGELQRADYLAAVSGGSYIAGAHAITGSCSAGGGVGHPAALRPRLGRGAVPAQPHDVPVPEPVGCGRGPVAAGAGAGREHRVRRHDPVHRGPSLRVDHAASRFEAQLRSVAGGAGRIVERTSAAADNAEVIRKVTFDTIPWALPLVLVLLALAIGFGLFDLLLRPQGVRRPLPGGVVDPAAGAGLPHLAVPARSAVGGGQAPDGCDPDDRLPRLRPRVVGGLGRGLDARHRRPGPPPRLRSQGGGAGRVGRRRVGDLEEGRVRAPRRRATGSSGCCSSSWAGSSARSPSWPGS